ncbi:MAG: acetylxylan esterase [Verrucomicrobiales bacterium]|nr:acetylxylan esterase [Verrucomicrobiales bacterium]
MRQFFVHSWLCAVAGLGAVAAATNQPLLPGDALLERYFAAETAALAARSDSATAPDAWLAHQAARRAELRDMLGLDPWPERTPLRPRITGRIDREDFTVERLHFQSLPGLYVTGNLYLPVTVRRACPTVLYVCGHSFQTADGISYGNKTGYHHHGVWFARHGYVCLIIDTLQLGEIEGIHHGTYRHDRWWWNSRGYTPAGVEAWNCVRALDYLTTRPEVDPERFGITGRSGGGAYSWFAAAIDPRIKVVAPVAGITDLENHVVDGTVEGHCDCMFFVNTHRWDYPMLAALIAPRPLLLANSDKDSIFPLDGVLRVHQHLRPIYEAAGAADRLGLLITEGPHQDTQDLQVPVFRWFNRFLKQDDFLIERAAAKVLDRRELRVFAELPKDEVNTQIDKQFVPMASEPEMPASVAGWHRLQDAWREGLRQRVFRGWPIETPAPETALRFRAENLGLRVEVHTFTSQQNVVLPLVSLERLAAANTPGPVTMRVVDEAGWETVVSALREGFAGVAATVPEDLRLVFGGQDAGEGQAGRAIAALRTEVVRAGGRLLVLPPRGVGPTAWTGDARRIVQVRRRFMLLGQTLDGMRVWDIRRGLQAAAGIAGRDAARSVLEATGGMAMNALLAAVFEPGVAGLRLTALPSDWERAPDYLNIARVATIPALVALAGDQCEVVLTDSDPTMSGFAQALRDRFRRDESGR